MARWLSAGRRCSWRMLVVCGLTGIVIFQLYNFSRWLGVRLNDAKFLISLQPPVLTLQELDQVEEMHLLPPYDLKYPQTINLNEEFLNASSNARNIFFPKVEWNGAIDPRKEVKNNSYFYYPGKVWLDTDGNPIQAHGGGILFDSKSETYFWYGEYKNGPTYHSREKGTARVDVIGVSCYSSTDMWAWKFEGIALAADEHNENSDNKASAGVAVSDSPIGPFRYLYSLRPNGFDSRDMTVFKDDDGTAYLIYSSVRNKELHVTPLNQDYTDVTKTMKRALVGQHREAPAVFKHRGVYYMVTSGCSGWAPNEALVHEAESIFGPWETIGNPCVGANKQFRAATFFSQGCFVLPMPGADAGTFVFMADRWNPHDLRDSRYVWLPLTVRSRSERYNGIPLWSRVSIKLHDHSASSTIASSRRRTNPTATPTRTRAGMMAAILKISAMASQVELKAPPFPGRCSFNELTTFAKDCSVLTGRPNETTLLCALSPPNELTPFRYFTLVLLTDDLPAAARTVAEGIVADAVAIG